MNLITFDIFDDIDNFESVDIFDSKLTVSKLSTVSKPSKLIKKKGSMDMYVPFSTPHAIEGLQYICESV